MGRFRSGRIKRYQSGRNTYTYFAKIIINKVKPFDPEFADKLNFYVNAVNEFVKRDSDNPTIGLLICKDMNRTEVQLALSMTIQTSKSVVDTLELFRNELFNPPKFAQNTLFRKCICEME